MTQEEILQYNKRCALFLGWTYVEDGDSWIPPKTTFSQFYTFSSNLMYDSDWNWIMEVVEAIEKLKYNITIHFHPKLRIQSCSIYNQEGELVSMREGNYISKKDAVVQAINQFLIWYNENKG